jgi:hypothetical protein
VFYSNKEEINPNYEENDGCPVKIGHTGRAYDGAL